MQMSKVQIAFSLVDFYSGHEAPSLNPFEPEASEVNQLRFPDLINIQYTVFGGNFKSKSKYILYMCVFSRFLDCTRLYDPFKLNVGYMYYRVLTGNTSMRDPVFRKFKLAPIECLHD